MGLVRRYRHKARHAQHVTRPVATRFELAAAVAIRHAEEARR